jgi:hypothetical protein
MKTLLKFATGAALAGGLANMLMKKRAGRNSTLGTSDGPERSYDQNLAASSAGMSSADDAGTATRFDYGTPTQDSSRRQNVF